MAKINSNLKFKQMKELNISKMENFHSCGRGRDCAIMSAATLVEGAIGGITAVLMAEQLVRGVE